LLGPSEVGNTHRLARRGFGKTKECFEYTLVQKSQIELEPTWVYKTRLLPRTESSRIDASKQVGCLIE
jgi:hypothetical protein